MEDIFKKAGRLFNDYWKEFRKTVPEDQMRCARFWCNHGFLSGAVGGPEDTVVRNYPLSYKYYANARKEGVKYEKIIY